MSDNTFGPLVSTDWLAANLDAPDLRVVDGSFYLPTENRSPRGEYDAAHIPGAAFFDIDGICDPDSELPHMFPSAARFGDEVGKLGIGNGHRIVCYDGGKMTGACRVWWMFRAFGHDNVAVLDGGMSKWRADGHAVTDARPAAAPATFAAEFSSGMVRSVDEVLALTRSADEQILDARSAGRFTGREPEPRAGMRSGHMPGAFNLPYTDLLSGDGTLKPPADLKKLFRAAGVNESAPVVTSCGSGISAALLLLGLHIIGRDDVSLYDGSWSEWGSRADTPVVN